MQNSNKQIIFFIIICNLKVRYISSFEINKFRIKMPQNCILCFYSFAVFHTQKPHTSIQNTIALKNTKGIIL